MPVGPRIASAEDMAAKMLERSANAGNDWVKRSLSPRRDPVQAALAKNELRISRFNQSVVDKTYESSLQKMDPAVRDATIQAVGAGGYTAGIQARKEKIRAAFARLQPILASHVATIDAMPAKTDADMKARMLANLDGMKAVGRKYKQSR